MAQSKATKKFEKRHLKGFLEKRNELKKTKQRQQIKAKKKARRAEEHGVDVTKTEVQLSAKKADASAAAEKIQSMSVDDFFKGDFEVPEMPKVKGGKPVNGKRKRDDPADDSDGSLSEVSIDREAAEIDSEDETDSEGDLDDFKDQLNALAEKDPEFHRMLKEDEPEVFDDLDGLVLSDDEATPKRKKQRKGEPDSDEEAPGKSDLDMATVKKWQQALIEQHSLRAAKEVVLAFRTSAQVSLDDTEEKTHKYSVSDADVYHQLLITALKYMPAVFQHHLPVQENKNGKVHIATESKKFKNLVPLLRSQISGILHLLDHLSDASTLKLTLGAITPLLPYLLSFKKLVRDLTKAVSEVWSSSSNNESTRIAAFLVLRRLVEIGDLSIRENTLKAAYQGLVRSSRNTTVHTMGGVNLMKNSAADLWGLASGEGSVAYTTAFTFIRSLAMHLRSSITNNSNESYKAVYNWQYVHSLDFWSRVLAAHCTEPSSSLRPLIYPLVQVTLGALRLIPTATYFPLRFQLIRSLLRISLSTGTYIPLAAPLYEVLASAEMRKAPKPSTQKPLDFSTTIRAPKGYLRTRAYQDGIAEQVQELASEFFVLWAKSVAFPELCLAPVTLMKRWLKDVNQRGKGGNKNSKANNMVQLLVQKIEANARWIEGKRAKVDFAPSDRRGVEAFLSELSWEKTPLGAFVVGQRKTREQRAKMIEESRKEDDRRRRDDERREAAGGGLEDGSSGSEDADGYEDEDEEMEEMDEDEDGFDDSEDDEFE